MIYTCRKPDVTDIDFRTHQGAWPMCGQPATHQIGTMLACRTTWCAEHVAADWGHTHWILIDSPMAIAHRAEYAELTAQVDAEVAARAVHSEATMDLARAVLAHAEAHYNDGGWDVVVECWELYEIAASLVDVEDGVQPPTTAAEAIKWFAAPVSVWADRQADARNSAF